MSTAIYLDFLYSLSLFIQVAYCRMSTHKEILVVLFTQVIDQLQIHSYRGCQMMRRTRVPGF